MTLRIAFIVLAAVAGLMGTGCAGGDEDAGGEDLSDDDTAADDDSGDDADGDDTGDDAGDDTGSDDDTGECVPRFPDVLIASHRGASWRAPEDTVPAFEAAFELGADIVEMDIRDTADGAFVIMHDDTVDRTTNGTGLVSDLTLEEIKALFVDDWMFGGAHAPLRVPTFAEALEVVRAHNGQAYLDMKTDMVEGAISVVVDTGMEAACFAYSSDPNKLARVRSVSPLVRIQPSTSSVEQTQSLIDFFDPDPEHIELADGGFTTENIALIHSVGAIVSMDALGVRDYLAIFGFKGAWYQMMEAGLQIVQTDAVGLLVPYRDSLCE